MPCWHSTIPRWAEYRRSIPYNSLQILDWPMTGPHRKLGSRITSKIVLQCGIPSDYVMRSLSYVRNIPLSSFDNQWPGGATMSSLLRYSGKFCVAFGEIPLFHLASPYHPLQQLWHVPPHHANLQVLLTNTDMFSYKITKLADLPGKLGGIGSYLRMRSGLAARPK